MDLPNSSLAIIDRAKLEGYLLSASHPVGRFKARFFARLGFKANEWRHFEQALREQHLGQAAEAGPVDAFGQSFTIRAMLQDRLERPRS